MPNLLRILKPLILLVACVPLLAGISPGTGDSTSLTEAPEKLALVIANADYESDWVGDLQGVPVDRENVSAALSEAGFEVTVVSDAGRDRMVSAIASFTRRMSEAPAGSTGLFYYSGQGASVSGGDDYLIPTDLSETQVSNAEGLALASVSVQDILGGFSGTGRKNYVLAIDTARYEVSWPTKDSRGRKLTFNIPDYFIIWASRSGDVAFDAPDGSAFSRALAAGLKQPGIDVRQVFAEVQDAVVKETDGRQYPEVIVQSSQPLVLNGAATEETPVDSWDSTENGKSIPLVQSGTSSGPRAADISLELVVWESAVELGTVESIQDFIDRFPASVLIGQARLRLAALTDRGAFAPARPDAYEYFEPEHRMPGPERIALLIGNKDYAPNMTDLTNPYNDVQLIKDRLLAAGFEVMLYRDVDSDVMAKALSAFTQKLASAAAEQPPVAFFYYSGHGLAPDEAGPNYLVPVGMKVNEQSDLIRAQPIEKVVDFVEATKPAFAFFVLDACRNNPGFADEDSEGSKGDSEWKTISRVNAVTSSLVAFATAPGARASDTPDRPTGPYAEALADALSQPGLDATRVFKLAQREVYTESNHKQVPWISDALMEDFYFLPEAQMPPAP
ncbi:MAG: caspase family protein [Hyphomonas sp.]|nr:caspase family protein [Hyphomonas sp.]